MGNSNSQAICPTLHAEMILADFATALLDRMLSRQFKDVS